MEIHGGGFHPAAGNKRQTMMMMVMTVMTYWGREGLKTRNETAATVD